MSLVCKLVPPHPFALGSAAWTFRCVPEHSYADLDSTRWDRLRLSSVRDFFGSARRGGWQEHPSAESPALYERIAAERLDARLRAWLEGGRGAAGDPRAD